MSERPGAWHRDSLPAWAWIAMTAMRLWSVFVAVLPLAAFLATGWLWLHRHDPAVVAASKTLHRWIDAAVAALERATR